MHGLLKCQSCNTMWNRDVNGASNIYKIAYNTIHKKERPSYVEIYIENLIIQSGLKTLTYPKFTIRLKNLNLEISVDTFLGISYFYGIFVPF